MLKKYPHLHDKIEFNISVPSYNFSIKKNINQLFKNNLNFKEKNSFIYTLKSLTKDFYLNKRKILRRVLISLIL